MNELWTNRGMLLEHLLNRTLRYYEASEAGLFEKRSVPVSFRRVGSDNRVAGRIVGTAKVDYLGYAQGRYYEFEAKQAKGGALPLSAFAPHQLQRLQAVLRHGGCAFVIVAFDQCDEMYLLKAELLLDAVGSGVKSLKREYLRQKCPALAIQTPGIIDFLAALKAATETT